MASDYVLISRESEKKYGTEVSYYGRDFADRYTERTHFIFELLQNAEDALRLRDESEPGHHLPRSVEFRLFPDRLEVTHHGKPFDEEDVRAICSIKRGTKHLTDIGKFGIGFKSVYAYTRSPEVHSEDEHFVIESYVHPRATPVRTVKHSQTLFYIPFDHDEIPPEQAYDEIAARLARLGFRTLLFLNEIASVDWEVVGKASGSYIRETKLCGDHKEVALVGQLNDGKITKPLDEQRWLVFARPVTTPKGEAAGQVEVAFRLAASNKDSKPSIERADDSKLVVFFPTEKETHCGFLMQGPYRTTPSRDNVPHDNKWNHYLVAETAKLVADTLLRLADLKMASVGLLQAMPLLRSRDIPDDWMFRPVYDAVVEALGTHPLIPAHGGRFVCGHDALFARGKGIAELFGRPQLALLFDADEDQRLDWVTAEISESRPATSGLYGFLRVVLDVEEIAPENLPARLTEEFFDAQTLPWMVRFYTFLLDHERLWHRERPRGPLLSRPFIRLQDDRHVAPFGPDGAPSVFLPGEGKSSFDTVHRLVAKRKKCMALLRKLGLAEPDVTTEVLQRILPLYDYNAIASHKARLAKTHPANLRKILRALASNSPSRPVLVERLKNSLFLMGDKAGSQDRFYCMPGSLYFRTKQLERYFLGFDDAYFLSEPEKLVGGDKAKALLRELGVEDKPRRILVETDDDWKKKMELRGGSGCTRDIHFFDYDIHGLDKFLKGLKVVDLRRAAQRARLLWDVLLAHLQTYPSGGESRFFRGEYEWFYYTPYSRQFDAHFLSVLRSRAWLPGRDGKLHKPSELLQQELPAGFSRHPVLCEELRMKAEIIVDLARKAGIKVEDIVFIRNNREAFDEWKRSRTEKPVAPARPVEQPPTGLDLEDVSQEPDRDGLSPEEAAASVLGGLAGGVTPPAVDSSGSERARAYGAGQRSGVGGSGEPGRGGARLGGDGHPGRGQGNHGGRGVGGGGPARPFVSYIGVHPEDGDDDDPDGLAHDARMELEEKAIGFILEREPGLRRTPPKNEGFDLFEAGPDGEPARWVEVKAMRADMRSRPATLTEAQFRYAQEHGDGFWLYVVEHTGSDNARIVKIRNPAGQGSTFTFDQGWLSVAETVEADNREVAEGAAADGKD